DALARIEVPGRVHLSRFDLAANVALFVPIGFFAMAAWRCRRPTRAAALRVAAASACLSASLEAIQVFLPSRTPSLADFAAEQIGAAAGVALWMLAGDALAARAAGWMASRERRTAWAHALVAYAAVWSVAKLFPFDA